MNVINRKDFLDNVDTFIEINFKDLSNDLQDHSFLTAISNISVLKNWLESNHFELNSDDWRVLLRHNKSLFDNALTLREKDINLSEPHQTLKNLVKEFATDIDTSYNLNNVLNTLNDSLDSYGDSISKIPILNARLEQKLLQGIMNKDPKARELLILYNLRLAYSFALRFRKSNCSLEDLVQESNMGLIQAADHFDATMNVKFPTYATYWMQNYVYNYFADMGKSIRLPQNINVLYSTMKKTIASLNHKLNREPTDEEIMTALGVSEETYQLLIIRSFETISLNAPINEPDDGAELQDILVYGDEPFDDRVVDSMVKEDILDIINSSDLTLRGKEYLIRYYGLDGKERQTLAAIGKEFGLSKEGVSEIINRAMKRILLNPKTDKLLIYTENPDKSKEYLNQKRYEYSITYRTCTMLINKIERRISFVKADLWQEYSEIYRNVIRLIQEGFKSKRIAKVLSISRIELARILCDILSVCNANRDNELRLKREKK